MKQKLKKLFGKSGRRALVLSCAAFASQALTYAQGNPGVGAITKATQTFSGYLDPVQKLLYAISAIIAVIGAFTIFNKLQNGDQDVKKTILQVVGGCVAFMAMAAALPQFFKI